MTNYIDKKSNPNSKTPKEVYYVTAEQYDTISRLNDEAYPSLALAMNTFGYGSDYEERFSPDVLFTDEFIDDGAEALTRFLSGDKTIEYRLKEKVYRLWRIDRNGDKVYMRFDTTGTPNKTDYPSKAFIAPFDEIEVWATPAWNIESAD